jgi:4-diphosphocytidyl-2-C-methyl-D-erythritol kinase
MSRGRSPRALRIEAPAKVNLFLEVTGRRADGYHLLDTVFAKIDLSDELTLRLKPQGGSTLTVTDRSPTPIPAGPGNLALRAADAFREWFGRGAAAIRLLKRVPAGAGLGGGSADAAATLTGLARLTGVSTDLRPLGRRLGADVPFFLQAANLALGRGVGDRLRPLRTQGGPWWLVVVYPGVSVSTPEAYHRLRFRRGTTLTTRRRSDKLIRGLQEGASPSDLSGFLFNRLEEPVFRMCPESARARRELDALGARARLSGSGSCVFAVAPNEASARRWARSLRSSPRRDWKIYLTRVRADAR